MSNSLLAGQLVQSPLIPGIVHVTLRNTPQAPVKFAVADVNTAVWPLGELVQIRTSTGAYLYYATAMIAFIEAIPNED